MAKSYRIIRSEEMNPAGNYPETVLEAGDDVELTIIEEGGVRRVVIEVTGPGRGVAGKTGAKGPKGDKGDTGDTGPDGAKGEPGEKGEAGSPGTKGDTGPDGQKGDQGERGYTGEKGAKGDQGEAGTPGEQGEPGKPGDNGVDASAPVGAIVGYIGVVAPEGYLLADGAEYPRDLFPSLAVLVVGDKETFKVPKQPGFIVKY
jgi:hypothetical protein